MNKTSEEIEQILQEWEKKIFNGRYFEMFAITVNNVVVGSVSLYQHTSDAISAGPEIFQEYRRKGYAFDAIQKVLEYASMLGYKIAVAQVKKDNYASIALHKKLKFEIDHEYVNRNGKECYFFIRLI